MIERKFIGFMLAWILVAFLVWFGGRGWAASSDSYVTLDGTDDYASYSGSGVCVFNPTRNAIWWGWFYPTSTDTDTLISKWNIGDTKRQWYINITGSSLMMDLGISDDGSANAGHYSSTVSTACFTLNAWNFFTYQYGYVADGTSGATLYVNGAGVSVWNSLNGPIFQADALISIGARLPGAVPQYYTGRISNMGMSTMDVLPETVCGLTGHLWMMANKGKVYPSLQTGTSMYATFGPSKWANGTYAISGVSAASGVTDLLTYTPTTMTQDLDFSGGTKATL